MVSLVIGYFLSKTITIPIKNMMYKAKKIAAGEFEEVLPVESNDEIGQLTKTFNYMAKKIQLHLTELRKENSNSRNVRHKMGLRSHDAWLMLKVVGKRTLCLANCIRVFSMK